MAIQVITANFALPLALGDSVQLPAWDRDTPIEEVKISGLSVVPDDRWRFELFATSDHRNPNSGTVLATMDHDGESDIAEDATVNGNVTTGDSLGLRVAKRPGPDPTDPGPDEGELICEIRYDDGL